MEPQLKDGQRVLATVATDDATVELRVNEDGSTELHLFTQSSVGLQQFVIGGGPDRSTPPSLLEANTSPSGQTLLLTGRYGKADGLEIMLSLDFNRAATILYLVSRLQGKLAIEPMFDDENEPLSLVPHGAKRNA